MIISPRFDLQLKSPRDGWKKKLNKNYNAGGEFGDRGAAINELIPLCM